MSTVIKLKKGDILFREGDASDAMFIIKSGRIAITKAKGTSTVTLGEAKAGEMLGEMAFFDNKPRSAGASALQDSELMALPFQSLQAQFQAAPEWMKAMVRTINGHLREANIKIKNLEAADQEDADMFSPHLITRLCAIISLVALKCGEKAEQGVVIPSGTLRNYTIQIFQQPTSKMQKLLEVLSGLGIMKVEELGEGKQRISLLKPDLLSQFVDWYNGYLFTEESKRTTLVERELPVLRALIFYGKKMTPDSKNRVKVSLTEIQNSSMRDLNYLVSVADVASLESKQVIGEKQSGSDGQVFTMFVLAEVEPLLPFWEIVYALKKIPARG
jgi:CRP-like cAMP-binding protein